MFRRGKVIDPEGGDDHVLKQLLPRVRFVGGFLQCPDPLNLSRGAQHGLQRTFVAQIERPGCGRGIRLERASFFRGVQAHVGPPLLTSQRFTPQYQVRPGEEDDQNGALMHCTNVVRHGLRPRTPSGDSPAG